MVSIITIAGTSLMMTSSRITKAVVSLKQQLQSLNMLLTPHLLMMII